MKYLAFILMPAHQDKQSFKLKDFLEQTYEDIGKLKNAQDHILYQHVMSGSLLSVQDAVRILNAPVEMENVPESPRMLLATPLTHVILELTDDFDEVKPLQEFVARVFMLKPEAYPHYEMSCELDKVESRIRLLKAEIDAASGKADILYESLSRAMMEAAQLNVQFAILRTQPLEFKGPQFDRAYPPKYAPALPLQHILSPAAEAREALDNDNNAATSASPQASPSQQGYFAARAVGDGYYPYAADSASEETPSQSVGRHV